MSLKNIESEKWPWVPFEVKSLEEAEDHYKFQGYASIFNTEDLVNDVVHPGAFKRTMQHRGLKGFPIVFMHDNHKIIGKAMMAEDEHGWKVQDGRLTKGVQLAEETYLNMKAGAIDGMSFAYRVVQKTFAGKIRHLKELAVSEVTLGPSSMIAHPDALVTSVKTLEALQSARAGLAKPEGIVYPNDMDVNGLVKLLQDARHSV